MTHIIRKGTRFRGAKDSIWEVTSKQGKTFTAKIVSGKGYIIGRRESGFTRTFVNENRVIR